MVVDCYGKNLLSSVLADNILVEELFYLTGFAELDAVKAEVRLAPQLFLKDVVSLFYTVVTDMALKTCNKQVCLFLCPSAE